MTEFGKILREAREAKAYTVNQIAEKTNILPSIISDLENENFSKIVAPIYGRGFVKLYCEAVGLDPKPMIAEFMEILNGNRDVGIRERPVSAAADTSADVASAEPPAPVAPAIPEPVAPAPRPVTTDDLFAQPPVPPPTPAPTPVSATPIPTRVSATHHSSDRFAAASPVDITSPTPVPVPPPPESPLPAESAARPRGPSRYAPPMPSEPTPLRTRITLPKIPPYVGRIAVLGLAGLLILLGAIFGLRALYRATTARPATPAAATPSVRPSNTPTAALPAAPTKRTPQKIPSLYAD